MNESHLVSLCSSRLSYDIIDISQPISSKSACFPGDTPFSRDITLSYEESHVVNLTAIKMSPHIGTHADSPVHILGDLADSAGMANSLPLRSFIGPTVVFDLSPLDDKITIAHIEAKLATLNDVPERVLFKTRREVRYEVFEEKYAFFSVELVNFLARKNVLLIGIDTPSVDHIHSKTLEAHHALVAGNMCWLENLDMSSVLEGHYFLIAPPLKLSEVEASPVRAVLLAEKRDCRLSNY